MKKKTAIPLLILSTLLLSSCFGLPHIPGIAKNTSFPEEYQVKNQTNGKISTFGLNIATADEMGDRVVGWVSGLTDKEGFQYLICSDPDSWDGYLFYPKKQPETQMLTNDQVAVEYVEHTLNVYVTTPCQESTVPSHKNISAEEQKSAEPPKKWILHFAAPTFGAWPSDIRLYWNGSEVSCDSADISD